MRKNILYSAVLILWSCQTDSPSEGRWVLSGFYRLDNHIADVRVGRFGPDGVYSPEINEHVSVLGENEVVLTNQNEVYINSGDILNTGDSVYLKWNGSIVAVSAVPPIIEAQDMGSTEIIIDPDLPGQEVFDITWTNLGGNYSYVLTLENLEDVPILIPFDTESGLFSQQYNGPIEERNALLYDLDFKFYGQHRLTIYAVEKQFAELFFYRNRSGLDIIQTTPDNVTGAIGFWGVTRAFEVLLNVQ
jgi:hypothetical protein